VSYLDVGLKLEVEPLVYLEDEVGIKVGLEVSNIAREVRSTTSSTLTYQIGTRNATTTLRLRDGETQILAGLINDEDRRTASRVPGLGELPVLGRLFSSTSDSVAKTEIMLLITPRLLRTVARPGASALEFAAGTEASTGVAAAGGFAPAPAPSFAPPEPALAPQGPQIPGASQTPPNAASPPLIPSFPALPAPDMVPFGGQKPPGQ
jgi:general secretion pathway protein D